MPREVNGIVAMDAEKPISALQCKMGRAGLGLSQGDLAHAIGMSERTIYAFEKKGEAQRSVALALRKVLEARGCRFWEGPDETGVTVRAA